MVKPQRPPSGRTNLASCIVATIFLIFVVIIILIVYFTVFKPKDAKISVNAVQLPSFSVGNNSVSFTFSQYVTVKNPNKAAFSHYDSTVQLLYSGSQVGFMFIPAGKIEAGQTQYMAATFAVQSFPLSPPNEASAAMIPGPTTTTTTGPIGLIDGFGATNNGYRVGPTMEIESRMEMAGRVRVLHFFTHHVDAKSECRVTIAGRCRVRDHHHSPSTVVRALALAHMRAPALSLKFPPTGAQFFIRRKNRRHQRTPEQRRAIKRENDRRRRREHTMEFQRLQKSEAELLALLETQRGENRQLMEENERLNLGMSNLMNQMHQLRQQMEQQRHQQALQLDDSLLKFDNYQIPDHELANNEAISHQGSQVAVMYADELVEDFLKKLDARDKSNVDFSDFDGLKDELRTTGIDNLPTSLAVFDTSIKQTFGEIAADSTQSSCTAMPSHILFCAAIREMHRLQLGEIDERKILLWRDAINSALNINFKVDFAMMHLKRIAHAFFRLKAQNDQFNDPELKSIAGRIAQLMIEHHNLQEQFSQKVEERNSEVRKQCLHEAQYFSGKFLSTGLLP
ncbi:Late embryogenesis abundant protein, LEA-14 [Corchorus capsularis]|uniref:Late embryogenesis abundant protein, LEA-14 n=1 Tax=Corchorus capsularis TaxID=210143 RepID=A0A1R3IB39_COCAP|nr:Late embryogenesis abundant protein, LEA-14 [Corchorus capsularis]